MRAWGWGWCKEIMLRSGGVGDARGAERLSGVYRLWEMWKGWMCDGRGCEPHAENEKVGNQRLYPRYHVYHVTDVETACEAW